MSIVTVVAKLVAKKDSVEAVRTEMQKLVASSRQEEGCREYRLHQDNEDPALFIFYETWESMACLERHTTTPHYRSYVSAVEGAIEERVVYKMTCISGI